MLVTGMLLMLANMSIEPIITVYVAQVVDVHQVTFVAGLVMSAAALGSILSASYLGKLADRMGHWNVIIGCLAVAGILLIPQAFVTQRLAIGRSAIPDGSGARRTAALRCKRDPAQRAGVGCRQYARLFDVCAIYRAGCRTACRRFCRRAFRHA